MPMQTLGDGNTTDQQQLVASSPSKRQKIDDDEVGLKVSDDNELDEDQN